MFGIKKRMRACSRSIHAKVGSHAAECVRRLKSHLRYDERVERANIWAALHPKRFFCIVLGTSAIILASSFLIGHTPSESEPAGTETLQSVASPDRSIERVISGMRQIHSNNDVIRTTIIKARMMGDQLRHELDSLRSLPVKSREDSMLIAQKGKELEGIISFFERHEED